MNPLYTRSVILGSVVFLAACGSTPNTTSAPSNAPPVAAAVVSSTPAPTSQPAPMQPKPIVSAAKAEQVSLPDYLDTQNALSTQRSIYFDYDLFAVKPEFATLLEMHGKYLVTNPTVSIRVQGNADERGSAEYNLALGQKRADSVVRALKIYGVKESQMESISFGREKPRALGHDESAWSKNRRVDLAYPAK